MYNCIKCNKEFKFKSEFLRHKNRKIKCYKNKEELKCKICNINFVSNIYKIGQTKNIIKRFRQYPKGSKLLFSINCTNAKLKESEILKYLKENNEYYHYKEAGNEYFKCDLKKSKLDIQNIINLI